MKKYVVRVCVGYYCGFVRECATEEEAALVADVARCVLNALESVPMAVEWSREVPENAAAAPEVQ